MTTRNNRRTTKHFSKTRKGGGFGLGMLASKETKFLNLVNEAIVELNNQADPFDQNGPSPFFNKLDEIDGIGMLINRNRGSYWNSAKSDEIGAKIKEFKELINNKDDTILQPKLKQELWNRIRNWRKGSNMKFSYETITLTREGSDYANDNLNN